MDISYCNLCIFIFFYCQFNRSTKYNKYAVSNYILILAVFLFKQYKSSIQNNFDVSLVSFICNVF